MFLKAKSVKQLSILAKPSKPKLRKIRYVEQLLHVFPWRWEHFPGVVFVFVWRGMMSQCERSKPAETLSSDKTTSAAGKVDSSSVRGRQEGGVHGTTEL